MKQRNNQSSGSLSKCTVTHQSLKNYKNVPAFVLGNGISRKSIDPISVLKAGVVYGCNAQYREFAPHYLIAVDREMVREIVDSGYAVNNEVWTNPIAVGRNVIPRDNLNLFNPYKGWSSGPTALWLASQHNHSEIYILGFDYKGIDGKLNNVYADTENYKKSADKATYHGNWLNQTVKVIEEFKHIKYYRVIQEGNFIPPRLEKIKNLEHINYTEFIAKNPNIAKTT